MTHNEYAPERERCVSYRRVKWPLEVAAVSDKDGKCPELARAEAFELSAPGSSITLIFIPPPSRSPYHPFLTP